MTDKQLKKLKDTLPKWKDGKPPVYTEEQKLIREKIFCIDMINSILVYDGSKNIMSNGYLKDYIETLGFETVADLVTEQIEDLNKATILRNVLTDDEGLSYNSVIWADEQ